MFTRFYDAVSYVFSSYTQSKPYRVDGLDRDTRNPLHIRHLLDNIGSPDRLQRNIKITGSKGKGSTSRMIAQILEQQGYRVGLFTSPHLLDFTERIRVNRKAISEADFMRLLERIRGPLEQIQRVMAPHEYFGPVGITAVVAMLYFAEMRTNINVIELGRGARYDDVNALHAELAVITPVLYEHPEQLGAHISEIANNKAGIMTPELMGVVVGYQVEPALSILRDEGRKEGKVLRELNTDFWVQDVETSAQGTRLSVITAQQHYRALELRMLGRHQVDNAAVAMATAEWVVGGTLDLAKVRQALLDVSIPGRCQVIPGSPKVLIDGAINRESAEYVREVLGMMTYSRLHLISAVPSDKDYRGFLSVLAPLSQGLWLPKIKNKHLTFSADAQTFAAQFVTVHAAIDLEEAISLALEGLDEKGLLAIIGTQSLVAEALEYFHIDTRDA